MLSRLTRYRRDLHQIPELAFDLPMTKAYCLSVLRNCACRVEPILESGILAFFDAGFPETIAFRTDMDALPIQEQTGVDFSSGHPGRMHACGHDGHMAMLLVLAEELTRRRGELSHNVLLIFQPGEESGGGGGRIVASGALDSYGIRRIYALHVAPEYPIGAIASRPGAMMSTSSEIFVRAKGVKSHAAQASQGKDALHALARFYLEGTKAVEQLDPGVPRLLHFGVLQGGNACNVVCDSALLHGTMRAFSRDFFEKMKHTLLAFAKALSDETGVCLSVTWDEGYPPLINDPDTYREAWRTLSDMHPITMPKPSLLTEDFAFYLERFPGMMIKLGVDCPAPLHADTFQFDERALLTGEKALLLLAGLPVDLPE